MPFQDVPEGEIQDAAALPARGHFCRVGTQSEKSYICFFSNIQNIVLSYSRKAISQKIIKDMLLISLHMEVCTVVFIFFECLIIEDFLSA